MSKKSSIFTAVLLLLLGVGVACWTTHFFRHREVTLSVAPPQSAKPLVALFENLPPNPNADQYAEYIHALGKSLSLEQQRALVAWMSGQKPAQIHERNWHYLSNEIMDKLVTQNEPLPELTDVFVGFVADKSRDIVLRDYSIQYLASWLQPENIFTGFETDLSKRNLILNSLRDVVHQPSETFSGTALQGLNFILRNRATSISQEAASGVPPLDFSLEQLHSEALGLLTAKDSTDCSRMSALHVCTERHFQEALPIARQIAANPTEPLCLRLSAIATIGQLGTNEDQPLLTNLEKEQNPRLALALVPALKKIKQQEAEAYKTVSR